MACQKATTVLFMCALLFLSFVARIEGSQNCYCECMNKCIPMGIVSEQECSKECHEACQLCIPELSGRRLTDISHARVLRL
ncbi:hypothetical protein OPV22_018516 [Ensete ventricosum]|uniref:Bowman-Birk serine protease inhibitors family domain-containing protein n=1 Tax=Ensete ventricosum TaxID=4639 RepID=A0AAV8QVT0_ENSVE|nr:hypothetical protein OPV22_018516 [Ensete ventricosum]